MAEDIKDKTVLITGASQGLGAAIARRFANAGAHVFVNFAHSPGKAARVVEKIREAGGSAEAFQCDISNDAQVKERFGNLPPIDILINNARLDPLSRGEMSSGEWFSKTLGVKLVGAYLATLAVVEGMKERHWGRIVNISSVQAYISVPPLKMSTYSAANAGLNALSRALAKEWGAYNITVNAVAPGVIATENMTKRLTPEEIKEKCESKIALRRPGTVEETADAILNVVNTPYMTGEIVNINGGVWFPA